MTQPIPAAKRLLNLHRCDAVLTLELAFSHRFGPTKIKPN